ncbi:phenoloxidase-activating factor 2-like [Eupeodes corollae]|uniref:phenoloxidase-activating factor 2-like n=1 Tax=Eupeodes corollae TaxID=290404 RepID=UPI002490CE75|nr:phenoloxidase-activating factor 2-like [Eupeodes corollae]
MSPSNKKVNLFVFVVTLFFVSSCFDLTRAAKANSVSLAEAAEKQKQDAEIHKILFEDNQSIQECLNVTLRRKTPEVKKNDTKPDKPLWTVVILREEIIQKDKTLNIQQCTGSLIHPQVVLTAAHCLHNKPIAELKVRAGEINRRPDKNTTTFHHQERHIESIAYQKSYDPTKPKRDIALVFLKTPFNVSSSTHIKTVCLPPTRFPVNATYVRCFVTGWEKKSHHVKLGHANFKKIDLPIIPNYRCQKVLRLTGLGEEFNLHKSFMCAGGELEKSALEGNGGAPLVCPVCGSSGKMQVQVGVMSWGFKASPLPEVFTAVSSARHWIMEELQEKKLKLPNCGIKWNQDGVEP